MADTYEAASVEGFTNTVKRGEDIDSDGDLEWVYTFRDSSTTSGAYDVVTTLDPSAYTTINEKDLIDIQNLAGNLNAVYSEKADSDIGAYLYFSNYATNTALENIPKYVKKNSGNHNRHQPDQSGSGGWGDIGDRCISGDCINAISLRHQYF